MAGPFKMKGPSLYSPMKTKLGRFLMGRKKETSELGTYKHSYITDKEGKVVKSKQNIDGTKVKRKYKKGNRPTEEQHFRNL